MKSQVNSNKGQVRNSIEGWAKAQLLRLVSDSPLKQTVIDSGFLSN